MVVVVVVVVVTTSVSKVGWEEGRVAARSHTYAVYYFGYQKLFSRYPE